MIRSWPLIFVIIPLIELYVIIAVGEEIGAFWTVVLVLLTAVVGVSLLRWQGMSTLMRAQMNMAKGQVPAMEMMEGMALAAAGIMLITPGFITDSLGFLLLMPPTRRAIIKFFMAKSTVRAGFGADPGGFQSPNNPQDGGGFNQSDSAKTNPDKPRVGRTIEGEYRRED